MHVKYDVPNSHVPCTLNKHFLDFPGFLAIRKVSFIHQVFCNMVGNLMSLIIINKLRLIRLNNMIIYMKEDECCKHIAHNHEPECLNDMNLINSLGLRKHLKKVTNQ